MSCGLISWGHATVTWVSGRLTDKRALGLSEMFDTVTTVSLLSADFVADQS